MGIESAPVAPKLYSNHVKKIEFYMCQCGLGLVLFESWLSDEGPLSKRLSVKWGIKCREFNGCM